MTTNNDEIINPVLKTHLDDGDKLVWHKDPTIIATWHSNGRLDIFDKQNVSICEANFRILKGHWRDKAEHGIGTESNHWLFNNTPISKYLELYPDFWKANEIKAVQPKNERKPRQKKEVSDKTNNGTLPIQEDIVKEYKYKSEKILFDSNYSDTYPDKLRKQATPSWVAEDMIDLLPDEVWRTDSKFLDIYCKSAIFLEIIIDRLMKKVDYSYIGLITDREIKQYIIENQVYAVCWNKWYLDLSRKAINGKSSMAGNIYCIGSEIENMTEEEARTILENDRAQSSIDKAILEIDIRKEFFDSMKIDAVVGNPPYNNDIYIPFVEMGHSIASTCSVFITPAKWQAKGDDKNEEFRQSIVPHMNKIVMYRDTHDVFDIDDNAGIAYYLIDKNMHTGNWNVKGNSTKNSILEFPWEIHSESELKLYSNKIISIIEKCKTEKMIAQTLNFKRCIYVGEQERGYSSKRTDSDVDVMQGNKLTGYMPLNELKTRENIDKYKITCAIMIGGAVMFNNDTRILGSASYTHVNPNQVLKGSFPCIRYFDTELECESFESFMMSKLMSFLFFLGICGATMTNSFFKYISDPGTFDHIFTDEELYKKYNLTDEEINIIESVIKERK